MQGDWRTSPVWQTSWTPNRLLHIPIFPTGSSAWILPLNRCLFHATHFNNLWGCLIQIFIAVDAFFLYVIIRPHERVLCIGLCKEWKCRLCLLRIPIQMLVISPLVQIFKNRGSPFKIAHNILLRTVQNSSARNDTWILMLRRSVTH